MIRVVLHHRSTYSYDRAVELGPQIIRLRPAPSCRTTVNNYSLRVEPEEHFLNWQLDPHGNHLARLIFPQPAQSFQIEVELIAELQAVNPFDFFIEPTAEDFPFSYDRTLARDLQPFLGPDPPGPYVSKLLTSLNVTSVKTIDLLVQLNKEVHERVRYVARFESGVQPPEETLSLGHGSCRDSAWLLVQLLRNLGCAARFVSGYLIQLASDDNPLAQGNTAAEDSCDLHAWAEVFLPGAGWVGLDATSGLLTGEGHLPLAGTPGPETAAPITGTVGPCEVDFQYEMSMTVLDPDDHAPPMA